MSASIEEVRKEEKPYLVKLYGESLNEGGLTAMIVKHIRVNGKKIRKPHYGIQFLRSGVDGILKYPYGVECQVIEPL